MILFYWTLTPFAESTHACTEFLCDMQRRQFPPVLCAICWLTACGNYLIFRLLMIYADMEALKWMKLEFAGFVMILFFLSSTTFIVAAINYILQTMSILQSNGIFLRLEDRKVVYLKIAAVLSERIKQLNSSQHKNELYLPQLQRCNWKQSTREGNGHAFPQDNATNHVLFLNDHGRWHTGGCSVKNSRWAGKLVHSFGG